MRDVREPLRAADQPAPTARSLARVAEALGLPVASFYELAQHGNPEADLISREEATLLLLVERHMLRIAPEARHRFVQALHRMTDSRA